MDEHGIGRIDLVCDQPLPVRATVAAGADFDDLRREHRHRRPGDDARGGQEPRLCRGLHRAGGRRRGDGRAGGAGRRTGLDLRRRLAAKAYARTAAYDAAISDWFADAAGRRARRERRAFARQAAPDAALWREPAPEGRLLRRSAEPRPGVATRAPAAGQGAQLQQHQRHRRGLRTRRRVRSGGRPAVAIIKHANPCGVATGATVAEAYRARWLAIRLSAFGGIIAVNQPLDARPRPRRSPRSSPKS